MSETLLHLLERAARFPETGLRFLDRRERESRLGWSEVQVDARRVATGLAALGVRPGERVALVYPTEPDFFRAFFGILVAGAVPVPLYPPVRLGRLDEYHRRTAAMLRAASAQLVLANRSLARLLGPAVAGAQPDLGCRTLADLPGDGDGAGGVDGAPPAVDVAPSDLALVQFSSGSTAEPRPVALSHRAVVAQTRLLNQFWPDTGDVAHSGVSWLPLYHDMGLIGCVFPALERPGVLTLLGPEVFVVRPATWLRALSRFRATISVAPNFAYGLCVEKIRDDELDGVDLSGWQIALNGAEPVAPAVLRRFAERFAAWGFRPEALTPVYGLSEASLAVTFSSLTERPRSVRVDRQRLAEGEACTATDGVEVPSLGRPLPGFAVRIVDRDNGDSDNRDSDNRDEDEEKRPWTVGRLHVRGPSLMEGYLDQPEATARVLQDGWLDTGDLGFLDDQGDLFLTSRAKDVLILNGRNHSPSEVEQTASEVAGVRRGCVVALSYLDEEGHLSNGPVTETLHVFVERSKTASRAEHEALPRAVTAAVLGTTGLRPGEVHVLEQGTLPRTSSGKLRRGETLRRFLAGELDPPRRLLGRAFDVVRSLTG